MDSFDLMGSEPTFYSHKDMMSLVDSFTFSECASIADEAMLCRFVMIPREQRMFFTDGMRNILGPMAQQDVLLSTFLQFVPDAEREYVTNQYDSALRELVVNGNGVRTINHSLCKSAYEIYEVKSYMQIVQVDKINYIVGFMIDCTKSALEKSIFQFFGEGINDYLFVYDTYNDICYLSNRFVLDFDIPSEILPNASKEYQRFVHPDDVDLISDAIKNFVNGTSKDFNFTCRFLSSMTGEIHLRANGISDAGRDGVLGGDMQYLSGCFTDVTEYVKDASIRNNLIDGSAAITFYADLKTNQLVLSENIREIFPDVELSVNGDILEKVANVVIGEDRKRFRDVMNQVIDGNQKKFSMEFRAAIKEDKYVWIAIRGKSFYDASKQGLMVVGSIFDLTQMNEFREDVERNASCHELTGLPTREKLLIDAETLIHDKNLLSAALVLVDVNGFHSFNDRYGRTAGNEILIAISSMLQKHLPNQASIYQIGIDTFCILWPHASRLKVTEYMTYLQEESIQPLDTGRGTFFVTYGLSASIYPSCGSSVDELLVNAEIALHKVKQDKKLKFAIYSPVDKRELKERLDFELQITQSIRNGMENFQLYYQPLMDAETGNLAGAEALLRWIAPNGELINPERVVNALETTDQMEMVGSWILNKAISQCSAWIKNGANPNFYVHINVTADDIVRRDFSSDVLAALARYNLNPKNILLEITETSLMKNIAMCRANLIRLRSEGIRIALDDFGTGYSSFNYLKELPVDEIKIDKAFVDDMETEAFNRSFICAIIILAHSINKKVCVEGVESEKQYQFIRGLGGDIIQGYYFNKPLTVFNFENKYFK
ncbi:MAG: GGDEF and EAL domain-containing protein [Clostridia bacterium]|nr:GGDEF and EAL domain-containing protein [Clostridia bacterium]